MGCRIALIDLVSDPDESPNAGQYRQLALQEIERLYGERRLPLIVGDRALYVRTLIHGIPLMRPRDQAFLRRPRCKGPRAGRSFLHTELARVDPELAADCIPTTKIVRCSRCFIVGTTADRRMSSRNIGLPNNRSPCS